MQAFDYVRANSIAEAVMALSDPSTRCLAGGTNLVDLMKGDVEAPRRLVDITRLPLADVALAPDGGLRIGALCGTRISRTTARCASAIRC